MVLYRLGVDYQDNYYEYEVPLAITCPYPRCGFYMARQ